MVTLVVFEAAAAITFEELAFCVVVVSMAAIFEAITVGLVATGAEFVGESPGGLGIDCGLLGERTMDFMA